MSRHVGFGAPPQKPPLPFHEFSLNFFNEIVPGPLIDCEVPSSLTLLLNIPAMSLPEALSRTVVIFFLCCAVKHEGIG